MLVVLPMLTTYVQSVANGLEDLQCQARLIQEFGGNNAVRLNAYKTEVVTLSPPTKSIVVVGQTLSAQPAAGVWSGPAFSAQCEPSVSTSASLREDCRQHGILIGMYTFANFCLEVFHLLQKWLDQYK